MTILNIQVLGSIQVSNDGECLALPHSRKSRALLAYLAITARPHRRDRLCEVFWDITDDPRALLRWSLSKLRPVMNGPEHALLIADRERVEIDMSQVSLDLHEIAQTLDSTNISMATLLAVSAKLDEPLIADLKLPDQELFTRWLQGERAQLEKLAARAAMLVRHHSDLPASDALIWSERWLKLAPYEADAARQYVSDLKRLGQPDEAKNIQIELTERFHNAGLALNWEAPINPTMTVDDEASEKRNLLRRQRIKFCRASDDTSIAYASVGSGSPVIKAANWLSHLELDWDAPIWSPLFRRLAKRHEFVRYDERGNGLSDWDVSEISFDAFVNDLESVIAATGIERFALLGISQGASVSIEYAVRYPERVTHLVIFGGYVAGWRIDASEELISEREAIMTLTRSGWGRNDPTYRQIFSSTFMPSASVDELAWFNEFQRQTTSPDNAARFLSAFGDIDVRHRLAEVKVPTLVLHSRGDRRIPFEVGRDIATQIPNAEFVSLDSDSHLLLGREPASDDFVNSIENFLATEN